MNATPVPFGIDIQVNTFAANDQRISSIAALDGGGFVVAWQSSQQDGSGDGVYARLYLADGTPVGGEIPVNVTTSSIQGGAALVPLPDGGFVVTWASSGQDGSGFGLYARRFDATGLATSGEIQISTAVSNDQVTPSIASFEDGTIVVAWMSLDQDGSSWGIFGQRLNASGAFIGLEFAVNMVTASSQAYPEVTALTSGGFVVTWDSFLQDGSQHGIYGQLFDASGAPSGSEFHVSSYTVGEQYYSSTAALADGGFVVTWTSATQDGSGAGIYAQRYDASGAPQGQEFRVNPTAAFDQRHSNAVALDDGGFLVTWTSNSQDGSGGGIYGQRFTADGNVSGDEFRINDTTVGNQATESIQGNEQTAVLADGRVVSTWSGSGEVFVRLIDVPDITPPGVTLALQSDTGLSSADGVTKDATLTGAGDASTLVTILKDGSVLGATMTDASGAWTFDGNGLADGIHTLVASQIDAAGNVGTSGSLSVTLDRSAPNLEILNTGGATNQPQISLQGTFEGGNGTFIEIYDGDRHLGGTSGNFITQTWGFPVSLTPQQDGLHVIRAEYQDRAGNLSIDTVDFILDRVAPVVTASLVADTGANPLDGITRVAAIEGTGEAGSLVTIMDGASVIGTATAGIDGNWRFNPVGLAEGAHSFTASQTDSAGNQGASSILSATLDRSAPALLSIVANVPAITNAGTVSYTVTFSEHVTGVDASRFNLQTSGLSGAAIESVTAVAGGGGAVYEVVVNTGAGDGSVALQFSGAEVHDLAGNGLTGGDLQNGTTVATGAGGSVFVTAADIDNDFHDDIIVANGNAGTVSYRLGNGDGTFAPAVSFAAGASPTYVAAGDFNGDGNLDIAVADFTTAKTVRTFLGDGVGNFALSQAINTGFNYPQPMVVADVTNDGFDDIVVGHTAGSLGITVLNGSANGTFTVGQHRGSGGDPVALAAGDLNGDGLIDIASASAGNVIDVYFGSVSGSLSESQAIALPGFVYSVGIADIDNDGDSDLVATGLFNNTLVALRNNGSGTFTEQAPVTTANAPGSLLLADVDSDGLVDALVTTAAGLQHFTNTGGTFTLAETTTAGPSPYTMAAADFDGDGRQEFVAANSGGGSVSIVANDPEAVSGNSITIDRTAPEIALDVSAVDENTAVGTLVGTLAPTGNDAGSTVSYELIDDAGGLFSLGGDLGDEILVGGEIDFELASSHGITVRVTDTLGNVADRTLAIGVTDVNEAPAGIALSSSTIVESAAPGTVVANVTAQDQDAGDTVTFTLDDDAGGLFELVGAEIRVTAGTQLDFEIASSHVITVTATDAGGLSTSQALEIAVADVNEAPDSLAVFGNEVEENAAAGTFVASIEATDPDAGDALTYTLTNDAGGRFAIDGNNIVVAAGAALDFEASASHDIAVLATDSGGLTRSLAVTINVTDANEAPDTLTVSGGLVEENSAEGTLVATLSATDPDAGDSLTFALADDAGGLFEIVGNEVRVAAGALIDFEAAQSHQIVVEVTDTGGLSYAQAFDVTVGNVSPLIVGTNAANTLTGTTEDDQIFGRGGNDTLFGLEENDELHGEAGNDTLDGGQGADLLVGGIGNDTYILEDALDSIVELAGEGTDTVATGLASFSLAAIQNVENLTYTGAGDFIGAGNALANTLTGGAGNDALDGAEGADRLVGGAGDDVYIVDNAGDIVTEGANAGSDEIRTTLATYSLASLGNVENLTYSGAGNFAGAGNSRNNVITGGGGNDSLNGGTGADVLIGGAGNDSYVVDNAGDSAVELDGEGIDTVNTSINTILGSNLENLVLTGGGGISGTGNELANALTGNAGSNTLNGGAGDDVMAGQAGNDTYVVDSLGDVVIEAAGQGTDIIQTALTSYSLVGVANVENLTFVGSGSFSGTGNELANTMTGGSASDLLDGGAGNDRLIGGLGDDTYVVGSAADVVVEAAGGGIDLVLASGATFSLGSNVENLTFVGVGNFTGTGNGLANVLTGGGGNDTLGGGAGNDRLIGGAGADQLTGGTGQDIFVFATGLGNDRITDFDANPNGGQDLIDITGFGIGAADFAARVTIADVGADTLVTIDSVDTIRLLGIGNATTVTQQDFLF